MRSIVLAHGGTVEAHSQEETGTTFTVRLPRHAPTALPVHELRAPSAWDGA
ncbi:hypothetical protein [Myxococcus sp. CA027]|uniref:hypothetical protein n=1 Tax=Myxococcus TaxID=32 RepID=UPI00351AF482